MKMRDIITTIFASIFVMISPIVPLFFLIAIAVSGDSYSQIWEFKKTGKRDEISYKKLIGGWFSKLVVYSLIVAFFFLFEKHIIHQFLEAFEGLQFEMLTTRVISGLLIFHEIISIDRSYQKVYGKSFVKRLRNLILSFKNFKNELKNGE